jgi:predicted O-methyltransferase YrrM
MSRQKNEIYDYIASLYEDEFVSIRESSPSEKSKIQVSFVEGKLLYLLLKMYKAKKVLEVGTLVGYSTSWIAKAAEEVITIELDKKHYDIAIQNFQSYKMDNVKALNGSASELMVGLEKNSFDAVFIDADKISYPKYLELSYDLLKKGGLIIADNVLLWSEIHDDAKAAMNVELYEAVRNFNKMIADETKFESIIIPTYDGLTVCIKK